MLNGLHLNNRLSSRPFKSCATKLYGRHSRTNFEGLCEISHWIAITHHLQDSARMHNCKVYPPLCASPYLRAARRESTSEWTAAREQTCNAEPTTKTMGRSRAMQITLFRSSAPRVGFLRLCKDSRGTSLEIPERTQRVRSIHIMQPATAHPFSLHLTMPYKTMSHHVSLSPAYVKPK